MVLASGGNSLSERKYGEHPKVGGHGRNRKILSAILLIFFPFF
jgi:hypothetical protein